jgi:hypothetical protein
MMFLRRAAFKIRCSSSSEKKPPNPVQKARKTFEKKRGDSLKENVNKLILIANKDIKEYGDFIKELDEIHKKELKKRRGGDGAGADTNEGDTIGGAGAAGAASESDSDDTFLQKSKP